MALWNLDTATGKAYEKIHWNPTELLKTPKIRRQLESSGLEVDCHFKTCTEWVKSHKLQRQLEHYSETARKFVRLLWYLEVFMNQLRDRVRGTETMSK